MKLPVAFLTTIVLLPLFSGSPVMGEELPEYRLEFKIAKERTKRDKKGGSANNTTSELWNYKVEVENRSLEDIGALTAKYTCYISTETRIDNSRRETTRKVTGDGKLASILRGDRSEFETKSMALKQINKTERVKIQTKNKNQKNNQNKKPQTRTKITEVREKLDGISVEIFHKGKSVAKHVVGDATK
jgi:hypothetical protein